MSEPTAESLGRFSTKLDLAIELALAELPPPSRVGFLSERQSRHQFMKWAMTEGICAFAKFFEDGGTLDMLRWRFEIVQGPGVTAHYTDFFRRATALDSALEQPSGGTT